MARFLIPALGSLGDLHPFIAVGLVLQRLGHRVAFCTFSDYQARLLTLGFEWFPIRTGGLSVHDSATVAYVMDAMQGGKRLLTEFIFPHIHEQYADILAASQTFGPDVLFTGELGYATRLVSEVTGIPWVSGVLQPLSMHSMTDPSVWPGLPVIPHGLGWLNPLIKHFGSAITNKWAAPFHQLRQQLGLPAMGDPTIANKFSPHGVLVMFDRVFATAQPDWPRDAVQTGFAFYDGKSPDNSSQQTELRTFCQAGPPPVVVTLGSAAVHAAHQIQGGFYTQAARAIDALGQRGMLLVGNNPVLIDLPTHIKTVPYARHSEVFPHACMVIHQGGVGTTAQALRAGVPSLVVPFSHDQPDNAHRLAKLGVGRVLPRLKVSIDNLIKAMGPFLQTTTQHTLVEQARRLQPRIVLDGDQKAANALLRLVES